MIEALRGEFERGDQLAIPTRPPTIP